MTEQPLLLLGNLLHVEPLAMGRLVTVDVIDAHPVRGGCNRSGHGLQRARPDRRYHRGHFTILPGQAGRGVRHRHFVAAVECPGYARFIIDPQDLAKIGRTMPENREVFAHPLFEQTQHDGLRQRAVDDRVDGSAFKCLVKASGGGNCAGALAHFSAVVDLTGLFKHSFALPHIWPKQPRRLHPAAMHGVPSKVTRSPK